MPFFSDPSGYSLRGYHGQPCPWPGYPRDLPLSRICWVARLAPAGLGRFLGPKMEPEKHGFVEEWFRKWRLGDSPDPNGLYGTQEAFGRARFPPNPIRKWFPEDFPSFGKIGEGPWAPPAHSLLALWGPTGPIGPLWAPWFLPWKVSVVGRVGSLSLQCKRDPGILPIWALSDGSLSSLV